MASYDVGLRIGVEGDANFQKRLQLITQQSKELNAEMKSVTSSFGDNDSAQKRLSATTKVLTKQIENQQDKIKLLSQKWQEQKTELDRIGAEYRKVSSEQGENSEQAKKLANEYATQARQVSITKTQLNNAETALNSMNKEMEKTKSVSIDWGSALKTAGVALGSIVASAGALAIALGKEVLSAYGEFEQLEGGVNKIFGDEFSAQVIANADKAFSTAGMSANDYLETVTGFSASLMQSVSGDTQKAVDIADMAIRDMSDNANTFGTDISSIQSAYQGFAKQNYTMLDNLRLGYGGTKSEMERLLSDAEKLTGIHYDISNLDDVYSAIHVIQEEVVDIAGTTERESKGTIQGSINRVKSSLANLWTGLGRDDSNLGTLVGNVAESVGYVLDAVTPIIQRLIDSLPTLFNTVISNLSTMVEPLLTTVVGMFNQLLTTIIGLLPTLMPVVVDGILLIATTLIDNLPTIIDAGIQLVVALAEGLVQALPTLAGSAPQLVLEVAQVIIANLPAILSAGIDLVLALIEGILMMCANLNAEIDKLWRDYIIAPLKKMQDEGKNVGVELVKGIWSGISNMASWLWGKVSGWATNLLSNIQNAFDISSPSKETAWMGEMLVRGLAQGIERNAYLAENAWTGLQADMGLNLSPEYSARGATINNWNITQRSGENGELLARRINRQLGGVYGQ